MYYQHLEEVDEEIKKSNQWLGMAGSKDSIEALIMDTSLWWKGRVKDWATIHKEQPCIHLLVLQVDQSRMERGIASSLDLLVLQTNWCLSKDCSRTCWQWCDFTQSTSWQRMWVPLGWSSFNLFTVDFCGREIMTEDFKKSGMVDCDKSEWMVDNHGQFPSQMVCTVFQHPSSLTIRSSSFPCVLCAQCSAYCTLLHHKCVGASDWCGWWSGAETASKWAKNSFNSFASKALPSVAERLPDL